jgi:hypothetical protein
MSYVKGPEAFTLPGLFMMQINSSFNSSQTSVKPLWHPVVCRSAGLPVSL